MSEKINIEELNAMIANEVKTINLHTVLTSEDLKKIQEKVMGAYKLEKAKNDIPEIIPENMSVLDIMQNDSPENSNSLTQTGNTETNTEINTDMASTINNGIPVDSGTSGNLSAYKVEMPEFINQIEPGKIIVFSQNELSEGGENLSNKPLRTYENPDIKRTMHELWMDKGQLKSEVYMVKLEKIGDLEFNYTNGTTQFIEKRFNPDFDAQAKYKENPYMVDNSAPALTGELDINGQENLAAKIESSVDINQVVTDIVMNILKTQLWTNTTKAVNQEVPSVNITNIPEVVPMNTMELNMNETFSIKMVDIVNSFSKIDSPEKLKEAITKNDKSSLINESEEVQEWSIDGKSYFTPVNKISIKKCYIK